VGFRSGAKYRPMDRRQGRPILIDGPLQDRPWKQDEQCPSTLEGVAERVRCTDGTRAGQCGWGSSSDEEARDANVPFATGMEPLSRRAYGTQ
jgi:hypothetical protein